MYPGNSRSRYCMSRMIATYALAGPTRAQNLVASSFDHAVALARLQGTIGCVSRDQCVCERAENIIKLIALFDTHTHSPDENAVTKRLRYRFSLERPAHCSGLSSVPVEGDDGHESRPARRLPLSGARPTSDRTVRARSAASEAHPVRNRASCSSSSAPYRSTERLRTTRRASHARVGEFVFV